MCCKGRNKHSTLTFRQKSKDRGRARLGGIIQYRAVDCVLCSQTDALMWSSSLQQRKGYLRKGEISLNEWTLQQQQHGRMVSAVHFLSLSNICWWLGEDGGSREISLTHRNQSIQSFDRSLASLLSLSLSFYCWCVCVCVCVWASRCSWQMC
jgi:hypothetical protein